MIELNLYQMIKETEKHLLWFLLRIHKYWLAMLLKIKFIGIQLILFLTLKDLSEENILIPLLVNSGQLR